MKNDIENNPDKSTETNTLLERKGTKIKINAIHHKNTLYARICGCIMYHWNGEIVEENIRSCVAFVCVAIIGCGILYFTLYVASFITTYIVNHHPQFAYYKSTDATYSINNTKHHIDANYESCYVEENNEHCRKYRVDKFSMCVEIAFSVMAFVMLNIAIPIIVCVENNFTSVGIAFSIANILFYTLFVNFVICVFGTSFIAFYGNVLPTHFKTFVHSCKESSGGNETVCEYANVIILLTSFTCSLVVLFIDGLIHQLYCNVRQMYNEYEAYREKVKDQIRTENVELV